MSTKQEQRKACIERAKDEIDAGTVETGEVIKPAKELKHLGENTVIII